MSNLEVALGYARRGWLVFQTRWITSAGTCSCGADCASPGKHPIQRRGVNDASRDEDRIQAWWTTEPEANIAIATGWESRLYVVDLDGPEGQASWDAIDDLVPTETLRARTGGGGMHLYFCTTHVARSLRNTARKLGAGIDTRGNGGYVLAPPSNHVSGERYRWLRGPQEPAELPGWLLARLTAPQAPIRRPIQAAARATEDDRVVIRIVGEEAARIAHAPEGERNDTLFKAAANVFELAYGGEVSPDTALAAMLDAATACGLPINEAQATIASAQQHGHDHPRTVHPRPGVQT